jgi:hypothetical protein
MGTMLSEMVQGNSLKVLYHPDNPHGKQLFATCFDGVFWHQHLNKLGNNVPDEYLWTTMATAAGRQPVVQRRASRSTGATRAGRGVVDDALVDRGVVDDALDARLEGVQHPGLQELSALARITCTPQPARTYTHTSAPLPCNCCAPSCPTRADIPRSGGGRDRPVLSLHLIYMWSDGARHHKVSVHINLDTEHH